MYGLIHGSDRAHLEWCFEEIHSGLLQSHSHLIDKFLTSSFLKAAGKEHHAMSSPDYSSLVTQLQNLSQKPPEDAVSRRHISAAVKEATLALETPLETVRRIAFAVSHVSWG